MALPRGRVLLLVLPLVLAGCSRVRTVAQEDPAGPGSVVVRARADGKSDRPDEPDDDKGFRFPADKGGALLARVLPPELDRALLTERTTVPRRLPVPPSLEAPTLPLPPAVPAQPRADLVPKRLPLWPRLVAEETLGQDGALPLPQIQPFATGDRTRELGVDVNLPVPLPLLGLPTPDRAALEDPTQDASTAAAVATSVPSRGTPVPFQRQGIPDPFENYAPVKIAASEEDTTPPVGPSRSPKQ